MKHERADAPATAGGAGSIGPECLGRLLDQHGAALVLFASQWTDAADDCVQEAFIELARQRPQPACAAAWLYRVVRNRAISQARSSQRRRRHEQSAALAPRHSEAEPPVTGEEIQAVLDSLDNEQREVIVARIWGGLTLEQTAAAVGSSVSTVHRRYEAGLRLLRERLGLPCPISKTK